MKPLISFLFASVLTMHLNAQYPTNTKAVQLSNAVMARWTTTPVSGRVCIDKMTSKGWEYSNSIVLHGIEKVYSKLNPADYGSYLSYVKAYVDDYVDGSGNIAPADMSQNLDKIHPGIIVLFLYEKYKSISAVDSLRYRTAATYLRNYLIGASSTYPKTSEGGYYHKNNATYTNVMMLDGIYMAHPFLAKYGMLFSDNAALDSAANQTVLLANRLHNTGNHLLYHAYDHARTRSWANAATGVSYEVWSRGMGWYVMALVDILKYLPNTHPKYNAIKGILQDVAIGIQANQDAGTGLWYQVVNKPAGSPANYLETSGSAMFVYALKTAVDSGWINNSYLTVAQNGWNGILSKITTNVDGMPQVNDFAPAMGVQGTSAANAYSAYVSIASVDAPGSAHPHGYAAVLMAASAMELSPFTTLPVQFIRTSISAAVSGNRLTWSCNEEGEVVYYSIEKSVDGVSYVEADRVNSAAVNEYSWIDRNSNSGRTFYRIKAVSQSGRIVISPVLVASAETDSFSGIKLFPNPIPRGEVPKVLINKITQGSYHLRIFNSAGAGVMEIPFSIQMPGTSFYSTTLPDKLNAGLYFIRIEGNGRIWTNSFIVN